MRFAIANGADGLEFDVQLSADGEVVVIHDPTVDRTTDGTGAVERMTLAELTSLDAGFRFSGQPLIRSPRSNIASRRSTKCFRVFPASRFS